MENDEGELQGRLGEVHFIQSAAILCHMMSLIVDTASCSAFVNIELSLRFDQK